VIYGAASRAVIREKPIGKRMLRNFRPERSEPFWIRAPVYGTELIFLQDFQALLVQAAAFIYTSAFIRSRAPSSNSTSRFKSSEAERTQ
jgi:hypothetical protein